MKKYAFEYYDRKYALKLFGICFIIFAILFSSIKILRDILNVFVILFLVFGIPLAIFFFNRKKLKAFGNATIYNEFVEFELENQNQNIRFDSIESYLIQQYNGTVLNLKMKNGTKLNVATNSNFNNLDGFDSFCNDFEKILLPYKNESLLVRRKTFFEKIWILPFIIIMTLIILSMIVHSFVTGKKLPIFTVLMTFGPLITLWAGYYAAKEKK